jgi:hypothetical protein
VDSIGVKGTVENVESGTSHGLLGNSSLLGGPLESSDDRVLDFVHVLNTLGGISEQVRTGSVGTESPNPSGIGNIPSVGVGEVSSSEFGVISGSDLSSLDILGKLLGKGLGSDEKPVVLVLGLGKSDHGRLGGDGLSVTDDGVGLSEGNTGVVILEIVQTDLDVELTSTSDNDGSRLVHPGLDTRVRLGESLKTLDKLGEIGSVLALDGDLDDGRDRELHDLHVVGSLGGGDGTRLEQELVDTDKTDNVTGGTVLNSLDGSSHHEDSSLNRLDNRVVLLSGNEVGALDSDLGSGRDGTGEDSTESVESTLVGGGNHLGDVDHQGTLGVTVSDSNGRLVVHGTLVQSLASVLLGGNGGWKVDDNHLEKRITGGQELLHDTLEQRLALEVSLVTDKLEVELLEKGGDLVLLEVHDGVEQSEDGVEDKLVEGSLSTTVGGLGPLLGLGVEVVVSPKLGHELSLVDTELLGVSAGELSEGEGPTVKTGTESDRSLLGVDLDISEDGVVVGRDNDVNGLDGSAERLVQVLLGNLEFEKSSVDLVDDNNRLDSLTKRLSKNGLGLDTNTLDTVDDDKGTIGDSESGSDFGREIDVTRRIDQVDQELVTVSLLLDVVNILLGEGEVHGDSGRLDGDSSVNLILSASQL